MEWRTFCQIIILSAWAWLLLVCAFGCIQSMKTKVPS